MELAGNKHCCTSDQLEVLFGWEDAFGQKSVDQVHSYEKRFRKQFQESLDIDQPVHQNFSVIRKNVSLSFHVTRIWLKFLLNVSKPHLNPVDVVQVLTADQEPRRVVAEVADREAVLELTDLVPDQIGLSGIYLLLLLRISLVN